MKESYKNGMCKRPRKENLEFWTSLQKLEKTNSAHVKIASKY